MTGLFLKSADRVFLCAVAAALLLLSAAPAAAQKAAPAHYGAMPNVREAQISPDGRHVAFIESVNATSAVVFYTLEDPDAKPVGINVGEGNARDIVWANEDIVLLLVSHSSRVRTGDRPATMEFFRWVAVSKSTRKATVLFENEPGFYMSEAGTFYAIRNDNPNKAVFGRHTITEPSGRVSMWRGFVYSLFEIDLLTGKEKLVEVGDEQTYQWITNDNGDPILRIDYDYGKRKAIIKSKSQGGKKFETLLELDQERGTTAPISFHGFSRDRSTLIVTTTPAHGRKTLREFDIETAQLGNVLFADQTYDIDRILYDPRTSTVTGIYYTADMPQNFHLDADDRAIQESLAKALPGASPLIVSKSDDGSLFVIEVHYSDHPKQFYLFHQNTRRLNMIAPSYRILDGKVFARKELFEYVSSDGLNIPGYLTVPAKMSKEKMPLIALPHGGPWARDDQSFDWWSFFYAARGYLVYQPNFRGSSGYGAVFQAAGNGEWGRKMQDDITEGIQKLIADGMVDPDRICIVGASYGGYAALAGATLTPDLYQCAVSVNGVSNIMQLLANRAGGRGENDYWRKRVGSRFSDADSLRNVSPMYAVTTQTPPIQLIHAEHDIVVLVRQSRRMRNALEENRIPHEYIILDGEDHWLSTGAMRTKMLEESIRFIDRHIGE